MATSGSVRRPSGRTDTSSTTLRLGFGRDGGWIDLWEEHRALFV